MILSLLPSWNDTKGPKQPNDTKGPKQLQSALALHRHDSTRKCARGTQCRRCRSSTLLQSSSAVTPTARATSAILSRLNSCSRHRTQRSSQLVASGSAGKEEKMRRERRGDGYAGRNCDCPRFRTRARKQEIKTHEIRFYEVAIQETLARPARNDPLTLERTPVLMPKSAHSLDDLGSHESLGKSAYAAECGLDRDTTASCLMAAQ